MTLVQHKRRRRRSTIGMFLGVLLAILLKPASPGAVDNPIVLENQQPGSSGWFWSLHADDATVSINFWVTPTEANLDPEYGGLVVCRAPPPDDWEIKDYDDDQERIVTFLEQKAADSLIVPYRQNRAVLFESRLFHQSDVPRFVKIYENHRINVTLLYGRHAPKAASV